jgi:small redox-active disulfide protein 2
MVAIKILGSGCPNCKKLAYLTQRAAAHLNLDARIEKITDPVEIMKYPILSTPGLVVNEKLICAGRVPAEHEIVKWLGEMVRLNEGSA